MTDSSDPEFRERVRVLWEDKTKSMSMIAKELGVTKNVIAGLRYRMGLPMRKNAAQVGTTRVLGPRTPKDGHVIPPKVYAPPRPKPVIKPPPKIVPRVVKVGGKIDCCRWPMWDHKGKPTHIYCDKPTVGYGTLGKLYCTTHAIMAKRRDAA